MQPVTDSKDITLPSPTRNKAKAFNMLAHELFGVADSKSVPIELNSVGINCHYISFNPLSKDRHQGPKHTDIGRDQKVDWGFKNMAQKHKKSDSPKRSNNLCPLPHRMGREAYRLVLFRTRPTHAFASNE